MAAVSPGALAKCHRLGAGQWTFILMVLEAESPKLRNQLIELLVRTPSWLADGFLLWPGWPFL